MGRFRNDRSRRDGFRGRSRDRDDRRGGRSGGFRRDSRRPDMHDVVCDKCGKECQVPFKPSGDKPVLCSDCFRKNDSTSGARSMDRSNTGNSSDQFRQINAKLDKILEVLKDLELTTDEEYVDNEEEDESEAETESDDEVENEDEDEESDED